MPTRSALFIDKIAVNIRLPTAWGISIRDFFRGLQLNEAFEQATDPKLTAYYSLAGFWILDDGCEAKVFVQADPKAGDPTGRFLRLEYNPARFLPGSLERIYESLSAALPFDSYDDFLQALSISRVDLAFDVAVPISQVFVSYLLRKVATERWIRHPVGRLQSMTFGQRGAPRRLTVYDKLLERTNASNRAAGETSTAPARPMRTLVGRLLVLIRRSRPRTRFEWTFTKVGALQNIGLKGEVFAQYHVTEIALGSLDWPSHVKAWFIDSCRASGIQTALSQIENQRYRTKIAQQVRQYSPDWWNPRQLNEEILPAVQRVCYQ